jgi:predicted RNA-binding protein with PUA-like domain
MQYFLAKTDPETYSVKDLERDGRTTWDGVRNPQALRAIRAMSPGDRVFIYHSGGEAAVVAMAEVVSPPRPDPNDARLTVVDLQYAGAVDPPVTLREIKSSGEFQEFALVRQARLSTMAAPAAFADWVWRRAKLRKTA